MSGILGIENRTENWKTTVYFSPLFQGRCGRFAERLGAIPVPKASEVRIELFWKEMRDYRYWEGLTRKDLERRAIDAYDRNFSTLRREVMVFQEVRELKADHSHQLARQQAG